MINLSTPVIFRYRVPGEFWLEVASTLNDIATSTASEAIATRIDSDKMERGISWELAVGDSLSFSSSEPSTGEPFDDLDLAIRALDAVAEFVYEEWNGEV